MEFFNKENRKEGTVVPAPVQNAPARFGAANENSGLNSGDRMEIKRICMVELFRRKTTRA